MKIVKKRLDFGTAKGNGYMTLSASANGKAVLNLYGDICGSQWDKWTNDDTCPQDVSDFLAQIESNCDLDVHINSGGGSVFGGLAIYNQLRRHSGETTAYIDGLAASIASVIPLACDRVVISSVAQYMIHKPSMRTSGNADELRKDADLLDLSQKSITEIYMSRAKEGIDEATITAMINQETWLTGLETSEYFDFEVDEVGEAVACTSNLFDRYKHTPENLIKKRQTNQNQDQEKEKEKLQLELFLYKNQNV